MGVACMGGAIVAGKVHGVIIGVRTQDIDPAQLVPGSSDSYTCRVCHRGVTLAPSGQKVAEIPTVCVVCVKCWQAERLIAANIAAARN